jgi:putative phosphonate metabolism protein
VTVRFAIYAAPGSGSSSDSVGAALRLSAERWLGRSVTGGSVVPGAPDGWTRSDVDAITVDARRYGFHGTLKAPFRLAPGRSADELSAAVAAFAAGRAGVLIPRLTLARLGGFFALVPGGDASGLAALADDVVTGLDSFRAPLTDLEYERRRPSSLTPRQRELLKAWGYPYVLEEFRFHLTLTDRIPAERRAAVESTLASVFGEFDGVDVPVDSLGLFIEAEPGAPFLLHAVHPLRPASAAPVPPQPHAAR